jgi:hypothetical protein
VKAWSVKAWSVERDAWSGDAWSAMMRERPRSRIKSKIKDESKIGRKY